MSNETHPAFTAQGRELFEAEGAVWLMIQLDGDRYFVKVTKEDYALALLGQPFQAHHPLLSPEGAPPVYLPSMTGTEDPWVLCAARCGIIAMVHPGLHEKLDAKIKKAFSTIQVATKADMPPEPKKGAKPSIMHSI